jgi:steroid delta-isomerase-like uncharacterized protein
MKGDSMNAFALVEAWNSRSVSAVVALYAEDAVRHQIAVPEVRLEGRAAIAEGVGAILHACPDAALVPRARYDTTDGRAVLEWTFTGTLENDFGPLRANGGALALPGCSVVNVNARGLIQHETVYWDTATLMAAAGLLPAMA